MNLSELYWHRITPLHVILWPLSLIFRLFLTIKRLLFQLGILHSTKLPVPVIVVDSITVGEVGKVSLVLWIIDLLKTFGLRPGIIGRGYPDNYAQPLQVTNLSKSNDVGNKSLLMAYLSKGICPIWIGYDRVKVAQALLSAHPECNVLVCDDGLQDFRLHRDLEIVLVDNRIKNLGNGLTLPAGPLRDRLSRLNKVDAVVLNQKSSKLSEMPGNRSKAFQMRPRDEYLMNLLNPDSHCKISSIRDKSIHVITNADHSQEFLDQTKYLKLNVRSHSIVDTSQIKKENLRSPNAEIILMREEDAVKYLDQADEKFWMLHEEVTIDIGLQEIILKKLRERFMDPKLLDILVCPLCKGPLVYKKNEKELICKPDRLAFPIRDGIPVMLEEEARSLPAEEEV